VTLRFFRRKSASSKASSDGKAEEKPAEEPKRTRSRSTTAKSTTRTKRSTSIAKSTAEKETVSTTTAKSTTSKTRRGRRGGVGRNKSRTKAAESAPAPVIPLRANADAAPVTPPSELNERELAEEQLATLRGLQGSLSAIENRLAGIERIGVTAEQPRVGIFVDVPNVIYAGDRLGVSLDFKKVLDFLVDGRELVRASAYAPISDAPNAKFETQRFVQPFVDLGYRVVTKPHKRYADGSMKANFDVELAMDVLTMSDRLDIVTLVSGDGDFRRLAEIVASKGVRIEVVAFSESTAAELRAVADKYIDLNQFINELRAE